MSKPVVVTISHDLGQATATARLKERIGTARQMLGDYKVAVIREDWTGNRLDFAVRALGQTAQGSVDVREDDVRVEIQLPWLLAAFAERAAKLVQSRGTLMLGHTPPKS